MRRSSYILAIFLAAIVFFITSCGPIVARPVNYTLPQNFLYPQPQLYSNDTQYRIQSGDTLDVKFFYNPELNEVGLPVRPDGRISLQLIDEVAAAGLTTTELKGLLKKRYESTELKDVEISVIVRGISGQKVFVDGEVFRAGLVTLVGPMSVMQAIAQVGGLRTETARMNEIILIRRGADNRRLTTTVDLRKAIDGSDPSQDMLLMPYDIVFVPKSPIANVDVWVDQYVRRLIPFPFPYVVPSIVSQ